MNDSGEIVFRSSFRFSEFRRSKDFTIEISKPSIANYIFYPLDLFYWRLIRHTDPAPKGNMRNVPNQRKMGVRQPFLTESIVTDVNIPLINVA